MGFDDSHSYWPGFSSEWWCPFAEPTRTERMKPLRPSFLASPPSPHLPFLLLFIYPPTPIPSLPPLTIPLSIPVLPPLTPPRPSSSLHSSPSPSSRPPKQCLLFRSLPLLPPLFWEDQMMRKTRTEDGAGNFVATGRWWRHCRFHEAIRI